MTAWTRLKASSAACDAEENYCGPALEFEHLFLGYVGVESFRSSMGERDQVERFTKMAQYFQERCRDGRIRRLSADYLSHSRRKGNREEGPPA